MAGVSVNLKNLIYPDSHYGPIKVMMFWTRDESPAAKFSDWLQVAVKRGYNIIDIIQCETCAYVYHQERIEE